MSVRLDQDIILLEGQCRVEDAEPLLAMLQADGSRMVDITAADHLHAAVVQVLLAFRASVRGPSRDPFLRNFVTSILGDKSPGDASMQQA
jgi:hypothetical protein